MVHLHAQIFVIPYLVMVTAVAPALPVRLIFFSPTLLISDTTSATTV